MKLLANFAIAIGHGYGIFLVAASVWGCASLLPAADRPVAQFGRSLFDGLSLQGWTPENGCEARIEHGLLVLCAGDGWLRSDYTYADFLLHVEWKALKKSDYDAGIYIRTQPEGTPFPKIGYQ